MPAFSNQPVNDNPMNNIIAFREEGKARRVSEFLSTYNLNDNDIIPVTDGDISYETSANALLNTLYTDFTIRVRVPFSTGGKDFIFATKKYTLNSGNFVNFYLSKDVVTFGCIYYTVADSEGNILNTNSYTSNDDLKLTDRDAGGSFKTLSYAKQHVQKLLGELDYVDESIPPQNKPC